MTLKTIKKIAGETVRVSVKKEQGKRVIGLHGFLSDIEYVLRNISGYHVEKSQTGVFLYSEKANWN